LHHATDITSMLGISAPIVVLHLRKSKDTNDQEQQFGGVSSVICVTVHDDESNKTLQHAASIGFAHPPSAVGHL